MADEALSTASSPGTPPAPVIDADITVASVNATIGSIPQRRPRLAWFALFGLAALLLALFLFAVTWLLVKGVGIWGVNIPVAWGFAIVNFVWWIGIGHAGTFISAFLLLMHQDWRSSINRFAEAMTIFAVMCAGVFPLLHLGRPWLFYFLAPYPDTMRLWPQWRSPLVWDIFAVSTYFTVSLLFWLFGLIPDFATMRDRATSRAGRLAYGMLAMGWRGSASHWRRYEKAYLLLGGLATPLVISVHSVVSLDFAVAILPGWHSTIMPPYFVAGAIFSGFAMVIMLCVPLRRIYGLEGIITSRHLENMAKLMLVTGLIVTYDYVMEAFMAWYSGDPYERYAQLNRVLGPYAAVGWGVIACNVVAPQALWFARVRRSPVLLFAVACAVQLGMWGERFVIVIVSLHRDFLPSSWGMYKPTAWDWATLAGTFGLFGAAFLLFVRLLPMASMAEMRHLAHAARRGRPTHTGESA
jgi:molybdopterin-containing oxidoreductase family membrane subunit